jgi:amidophosphoribosyltransferase
VAQSGKPDVQLQNHVKRIYDRFTTQQISEKISQLVTPKLNSWNGEVKLVFQTVENLHKALPNHSGDWYFTGKYPTPGGYKVLNRAYINYYENSSGKRSY